jgi:proteasome lid subunit RPN8/RPN11
VSERTDHVAETTGPAPALLIPSSILEAMRSHCLREAPAEACGILGGAEGPRVASIHPLRNVLASPSAYDADPADILETRRLLRERGHRFLAIYHSHPRWDAIPSRADLERNYYGDLPRIIVSLLADPPDVRAWRLEPDRYDELTWAESPDVVPPGPMR